MPPLFLKDVADVSIGLTMRGDASSRRASVEGMHLLRISDLTEDGKLSITGPGELIADHASMERYRVHEGDLVVANRGSRMTAAIVPPDLKAIAGGQLFVVRPRSGRVIAGYLHWFLNLPKTQEQLLSRTRGSSVKTLSIRVLKEEVSVPVPPLSTQRKVVEMNSLAAREHELVVKITAMRRRFFNAAMERLVTDQTNP